MNSNSENQKNSESKSLSQVYPSERLGEPSIPRSPVYVDTRTTSHGHGQDTPTYADASAGKSQQSPTLRRMRVSTSPVCSGGFARLSRTQSTVHHAERCWNLPDHISGASGTARNGPWCEFSGSNTLADRTPRFAHSDRSPSPFPLPKLTKVPTQHDSYQSPTMHTGCSFGSKTNRESFQSWPTATAHPALKTYSELQPLPSVIEISQVGTRQALLADGPRLGVLQTYGIGASGSSGYQLPLLKASDIKLRFSWREETRLSQQQHYLVHTTINSENENGSFLPTEIRRSSSSSAIYPSRLPANSSSSNQFHPGHHLGSHTTNPINMRPSVDWKQSNGVEPRALSNRTAPNLNDWETVVEMYFTGSGTADGRPLRNSLRSHVERNKGSEVNEPRDEKKEDRKILEKHRTIGRTYEALGKARFERHIGYCIDRNSGVRKKQRMYHVINRCRIIRGLLKERHELPSDPEDFERLLCELEVEKRERSRARKEASGDDGVHNDVADDQMDDEMAA